MAAKAAARAAKRAERRKQKLRSKRKASGAAVAATAKDITSGSGQQQFPSAVASNDQRFGP